jgi:hypothetical protein
MEHLKHRRMKELQLTFPLHREIEQTVTSFNQRVKDEVKYMSLTVLLNNCHPLYRAEYARALYKDGYLTVEQTKVYTKQIPLKDD